LMGTQFAWFGVTYSNGEPTLDRAAILPLVDALFRIRAGGPSEGSRKTAGALLTLGRYEAPRQGDVRPQWVTELRSEMVSSPTIRHIADVRRAVDNPLTEDEMKDFAMAARHSTTGAKLKDWARTIESILRDVFGATVSYEVGPHPPGVYDLTLSIDGQDDILIRNVGAGVREVVAIAYRALSAGGTQVLCIEEPENCLHPTAVRRLLRSILTRLGIQVFVSTHSPAVVNAGADTIIELERREGHTTSRQVTEARARFEAVRALGSSPADLVLTPCALWVEGPSDRAYLSTWLATEGLLDGVDYTIGFFGGALGTHVSLAGDVDPEAAFIELRTISRRCAVLVDSDRHHETAALKGYVQRWLEESDQDPNVRLEVSWGREIENYLPRELVNRTRAGFNLPAIKVTGENYRFARILNESAVRKVSKTRFARAAIQGSEGQVPPAAATLVASLATFIRDSSYD
jgi:hypothetical protein